MRQQITIQRLITVALVSICIGITVSAQTPTADTVLANARKALGGDAKIASVKSFIATGRTRQVRGENLVPIEFEIQAELPDKYSRRDEFPAQDAGPVTAGFVGDALVLIPRPAPPPPRPGAPAPPQAQEMMLRQRMMQAKQDFARLMLGMFAGTSAAFPVTYFYVGQAEAPQGKADVIEVKGPANFTARLFIADTGLPIMLSWQQPGPGGPAGPPPGAKPAPEQRLFFADYRDVDGLKLPFRIRRAAGAETTEETTFDRYRINARVDPRRFDTTAK
ncbi:MAG: hypothetical protein K2Y23_26595 [Cyanobacteria bacterium]|nr:hypothetical protein [Cyanobacteriota bacterium]